MNSSAFHNSRFREKKHNFGRQASFNAFRMRPSNSGSYSGLASSSSSSMGLSPSTSYADNVVSKQCTSSARGEGAIGVSIERLEYLQAVFDNVCLQYESGDNVNLGMYLEKLLQLRSHRESSLPEEILSPTISDHVLHEIMKLNHLHAHQEYLSWERFKHLLKEKTCLRLPIDATKPDSKERAAYFELLAENGISATKEISLLGSEAAAAIDAGAVQPLAEEMRESHRRTHSQLQSALLAAGVGATSTEVQSLVDRVEARASGAVVDDELKNLLMDTEDSNADKGIDDSERIHKVLIPARYEEIPTEEETRFKRIAHGPETDEVIIEKFNIPMTKAKLACLKPSTWLNDEVINFYFNMLQVRDQSLCERDPSRKKSHFFNSFFMERLIITDGKYTYANVKRWSKKFDVFTLNKVYFPVNISNMHWTLAIVDIVNKEIHYYDSMSGSGGRFLNALQQWLVDEAKVKKGQTLDPNEYTLIDREPHVPQQKNGCDCGVFTTVAADFISDSLPLEYSQKDMPFFRNKMGTDIMRGHLKYPL